MFFDEVSSIASQRFIFITLAIAVVLAGDCFLLKKFSENLACHRPTGGN